MLYISIYRPIPALASEPVSKAWRWTHSYLGEVMEFPAIHGLHHYYLRHGA